MTDPCPRTLGGNKGSVKGFDCIYEYFPLSTCLTVLSTVSATNGGQTGAAAGHVELVIHARVVR